MFEERPKRRPRRPRGTSEEGRLRAIIEELADGIVIVGGDGAIRFANPAAERLFARSVQSLVGTAFGFPIVNGEPVEIDVVRPGGETVTAELRVVPLDWEGEPARLISLRDVTDRRRASERALQIEHERAARAEAEAANRAKNEFLATMSHELRTPLNAVIGYAGLLDLGIGGTLSPEQRQQVDRIRKSGEHLLGLVNQVLDLSRVDAGRLTVHIAPTPADRTIDATETIVQPVAEARGIRLATRPGSEGGTVQYEGDEERVRQILINLITNAVRYSDAGGVVSVEYGETFRPDVEARLPSADQWVYFRVTDDGTGIPADQLSRIFEPFVQVTSGHTRSKDGSGLGLTISRRLARLMRGDLTVRSTVGSGSAFTLWLPAAKGEHREPAVYHTPPVTLPSRLSGLSKIGELMMVELEPLLDAFVARIRNECPVPGIADLTFSQLANHLAGYIADLAGMLITLEEAGGQPSSVLDDAADIHRILANRHGTQRARLGWTRDAMECEYKLLRDEIERIVRRPGRGIRATAVDESLSVIGRLLEQAEQTSLGAIARAAQISTSTP